MTQLDDKSVLISGASSGIGEYVARELVKRGARVGLLARRRQRLDQLATQIQDEGGVAEVAEADVSDGQALVAALDSLAERLGGVDVIIANAGYGNPEPPHRFKPNSSLALYDVNLFGMLRMIDWALPRFLEAGAGHIVGVASIASYLGMVNSASYCGSKAAMRVHLQALRVSLAPYGIDVTTICPGFVKSELTEGNKFPMPFMWETDRAARKIVDAIERSKGEVAFPWQMYGMMAIMTRVLPTRVTEAIMKRKAADMKRPLPSAD